MAKTHKELVRACFDRLEEKLEGELSTTELVDLAIVLVNLSEEEEEEKIVTGKKFS